MNTENAKIMAEGISVKAQGVLYRDGFLAPMLFAISGEAGEACTPVLLNVETDQEKEEASALMHELSTTSDHIILVMDTHLLTVSKKDYEAGNVPETLEGHSEATDAIVIFLYSKDYTFMKRMTYKKKEDNSYCFFDLGWEEPCNESLDGRFRNPYLTKKD